jgi:tetratricopeptide (TPR) repeat protein
MARFPLRALFVVALWAALPAADALAQDCPPLRHTARSESATLRLQAVPNRWYQGWLIEGGRELRLRDGDLSLSAAPARHARIPLWLQADQQGAVKLDIDVGSGPASAMLNVELHCSQADAELPATLQQINQLAARQTEHPDPALGWRLARLLFTAHYRHIDNSELRLWLLQQQLGLAQRAGLMEQAAGWAEKLAALAERMGRPAELALATLNRGSALLLIDGAAAERTLAEAERLIGGQGWNFHAALARQERCLLARLRGELDAAISCYHDVVERFAAAGEYRPQINAQYNLTTALFVAGRFAEGRAVLDANHQLVVGHGSEFHRARTATFDAQLAAWAGDIDSAIRSLFEARDIFVRLHELRHVAQTDRLLGDRYSLAGETGRAVDYYRRARRTLQELGLHRVEMLVVLSEARALASIGELDQALAVASHAERNLRESPDRDGWRNIALSAAEILMRLGRRAEASAMLHQLDAGLSTPQLRQRQAMLARLDAPGGASESELSQWLEQDLHEGRLVQALALANALVERLVERGAEPEARKAIARVEQAIRRAVGRLRSPGVRDALLRELQGLHALRSTSWAEGTVPADAAIALVADLDALVPAGGTVEVSGDAVLALERRIGNDLLGLASGEDSVQRDRAVAELPAAMANLGSGGTKGLADGIQATAVFVYPVMRRDYGGLLVHRAGKWFWQPIDLFALRQARIALHAALAEGHGDLDSLNASLHAVERALRLDRWQPDEQAVSLVAHAELAGLPLEWQLQRRGATGAITWLHRAAPAPAVLPTQVSLISASPTNSPRLGNLEATASELNSVRDAWPHLMVAKPAHTREALVAALQLPGALVHVAAHGRSAQQRHEESGLWLQEADGSAAFVSALRLRRSAARAALVVLSACETGYSPAQTGLGFGGVAASLVEAGTGAVVAARWPVGDRTARAFATAFHHALALQPQQPALALQRAQQALRDTPATRHPTHWAGWFLLRQGLPES